MSTPQQQNQSQSQSQHEYTHDLRNILNVAKNIQSQHNQKTTTGKLNLPSLVTEMEQFISWCESNPQEVAQAIQQTNYSQTRASHQQTQTKTGGGSGS